jgi:hypothetical protein
LFHSSIEPQQKCKSEQRMEKEKKKRESQNRLGDRSVRGMEPSNSMKKGRGLEGLFFDGCVVKSKKKRKKKS